MWLRYSQDGINRHGISSVAVTFIFQTTWITPLSDASETWERMVSCADAYIRTLSRDPKKTSLWVSHVCPNQHFQKDTNVLKITMADVNYVAKVLDLLGASEISRVLKEDGLRERALRVTLRDSLACAHGVMTIRSLIPNTSEEQDVTIEDLCASVHDFDTFGSTMLSVRVGGTLYSLMLRNLDKIAHFASCVRTLQWGKVDQLLRDRNLPSA